MSKRKKPKNEGDELCTAPLMGSLQAVPGTNHKKSTVLNVTQHCMEFITHYF